MKEGLCMRKLYHFIVTSHKEVMSRTKQDFIKANNCLAIAAAKTQSLIYAECLMATHHHVIVETDNLTEFVRYYRRSYIHYFNINYCRTGKLGEKGFYYQELIGILHKQAALSYVLRNPVHHGVTVTPFNYPYSSIDCYFFRRNSQWRCNINSPQENIDKKHYYSLLKTYKQRKLFLPKDVLLPQGYAMNSHGLIIPDSFVETAAVENIYITSRNFLYQMNRLSSEEWNREQEKESQDGSNNPITIASMERPIICSSKDPQLYKKMLNNETGRFNESVVTYEDICEIIDNKIVARFKKHSYIELIQSEKDFATDLLLKLYKKQVPYNILLSMINKCL